MNLPSSPRIPGSTVPIGAHGSEAQSVQAKGNLDDLTLMSEEFDFGSGTKSPKINGAISARRRKRTAVGTECEGICSSLGVELTHSACDQGLISAESPQVKGRT